ncbi:MAG TPA: methyl-accepting chemotaxis protein [Acetobacteraceae bacterium]|jgi:methyl-accepting chemotaxis protein
MRLLSHLHLRTKLAILMVLSGLVLIVSIGVSASLLHQRMRSDRIDKLHAAADMAIGLAQSLENQVRAHKLTRDQALEQFRGAAHAMLFDDGQGYIVAQTLDNRIIVHGALPKLDNTLSGAKAADGTSLTSIIVAALRNADRGVVAYGFARPGETQIQPKVAYVARFAPWNLVFTVGAYTADLDTAFHAILWELIGIGAAILLVTLLVAWLIEHDITQSLGALNSVMTRLTHGELHVAIPGTERRDEVGSMANAVAVFKNGLQEAERLRADQEAERVRAQAGRVAALVSMAETIEAEVHDAITDVGRQTTAMATAANSMKASANRTGTSADGAAAAAGQALANAQTVASAAEELAASIREIGGQVDQSARIVGQAVTAGRTARKTIEALNEEVGNIGRVADMIGDIAAKTNLLALNATIEAARAGEAGKGFAVVASEVKQLATQTARSTEEIGRHIGEVRNATNASVAAVRQIEATIEQVNAIAGSIAAAVEQQSAATAEIAHTVAETAAAANQMTERTAEVSAEANTTGKEAVGVLGSTAALSDTVGGLQRALVRVVRTSTSDVDRRRNGRRRPCYIEASILHGGRTEAAILRDVSEHGCYAATAAPCQAEQQVEIVLQHLGKRMKGQVTMASGGGVHVRFTDGGIAAAEVDRISQTTVAELVNVTKSDHLAYVRRVSDIAGSGEVPAGGMATQHSCRLGRWYDSLTDAATLALPSFRAIAEPHHAVHEAGDRVLAAVSFHDAASVQRHLGELRGHSERVLHCLDAFAQEYPTTIAPSEEQETALKAA